MKLAKYGLWTSVQPEAQEMHKNEVMQGLVVTELLEDIRIRHND